MAGGAGVELIVTGGDDGVVKVWEGGEEGDKHPVSTFEIGCPVTAVCWSADGSNIYVGALDNEIHVCFDFLFNYQVCLIPEYYSPGARSAQERASV